MTCAYIIASLAIGTYAETRYGDPWESSVRRAYSALGVAVAWPVLAVVALWCLWRMEDLDW